MRIMGLDLGSKTIGVAVSDALLLTAQPTTVIQRSAAEMAELERLLSEYEVEEILLGYPKNMNGTLGPKARETEDFALKLQESFSLPVRLWDERLSTAAASRVLLEADVSRRKRKKVIDKTAAAVILQNYLDSRARRA